MIVQPNRRSRSGRTFALLAATTAMALLLTPGSSHGQEDAAREEAALPGVYTATITSEDIPGGLPAGAALAGRWILTLDEDGALTIARADVGEVVSGRFEAGPATLGITAWDGMVGCDLAENSEAAVSYAWRVSDDRLTLTPIADTCPERLTLLTAHAFGSLEVCDAPPPSAVDPFAAASQEGTPTAGVAPGQGVAAQEGYGEGAEIETEIDALLDRASGCWAAADVDQFMALHGQGIVAQIGMMGPPEQFTSELQAFMETPLRLERIGAVQLDDPGHAWAYVEVDLEGRTNPQRMSFVLEQGTWLFDTFFLFGPPLPGGPGIPGL